MAKDSVSAGQFDKRISIQAKSTASVNYDDQGGLSAPDVWADVFVCWADMQDFPHGRGLLRQYLYSQLYPTATKIIATRYQPTVHVDPSMRIRYVKRGLEHLYQIIGIQSPMDANISFLFFCTEYQVKGYN